MRTWWDRFPDRWAAELAALEATGWPYTVREEPERRCRTLTITWPLPPEHADRHGVNSVRLLVEFPAAYPFFPPCVSDVELALDLTRHRDPTDGQLCLLESADWITGTTVAELLAQQLPILLTANRRAPTRPGPAGLEAPVPEPVTRFARHLSEIAVLVDPDWTIPEHLEAGALVARTRILGRRRFGTLVLERLLGPGLDLACADPLERLFPHTVFGRWMRMPDYPPGSTAEQLWAQV